MSRKITIFIGALCLWILLALMISTFNFSHGNLSGFELIKDILLYALLFFPILCVIKILRMPVVDPRELNRLTENGDEQRLGELLQVMAREKWLGQAETDLEYAINQGNSIVDLYRTVQQRQLAESRSLTKRYAKRVFLSTAIIQNGRLDFIAVLFLNINLIYRLVQLCGYRMPTRILAKIIGVSLMAALVAEVVGDSELITKSVAVFTDGLGGVPVAGSAVNAVTGSLLEGAINGFVTLRLGYAVTRCLYGDGLETPAKELRKASFEWARGEAALFKAANDEQPA